MEWIAPIALVILLVFIISTQFSWQDRAATYRRQNALFSPAERSFYGILCKAVNGRYLVFGKVRVADVIKPSTGMSRSEWQGAFNKIKAKHFDFILCNPGDLSVACVIELDDASHASKSRGARDRFLDSACLSANLAIHHFAAKRNYAIEEISSVIFSSIEHEPVPSQTGGVIDNEPTENTERLCPKCSERLVKRVAGKGEHEGSEFLGCSSFPKCRYMEKLEGGNSSILG